MNHLLSVVLLVPVAGALVVLAMKGAGPAAIRWVATAFAGLTFLSAVPLWFRYDPHGKTWQFAERGEWMPAIGASYYVGADGFSILLILLAALIVWLAMVASWPEIHERVTAFHAGLLLLQACLLGAVMALDFLLFFVFWGGIAATLVFLVRTWGGAARPRAPKVLAALLLAASVAMLAGILRLFVHHHATAGVYSFDLTQYHVATVPVAVQRVAFAAWIAAFAVMLPLMPLLARLRRAPAGISAIVVAVVLQIAAFGLVRFILPILPDASRAVAPASWLTPIGITSTIVAVAAGVVLVAIALLRVRLQAAVAVLPRPARPAAVVAPLAIFIVWASVWPAALPRLVETAVGRVVARANPIYAPHVAQGSDCPTAAPPDPAGPPPVFVLAEPCADGSDPAKKPEPEAGQR